MSDTEEDDEENFCFYGTPLDPYDEDSFPKRKPISIEDQVATDAQGRRRFHGAFTGGFSAGFFNTVGTPEGWAPSEFKSSRSEKASSKSQRPQDFMDDEDISEFGFAPQTVKATEEFSTKKKRKKQAYSIGPIPGEPVLHSLLQTHNETIGYTLMKNMGWKIAGDESDEEEIEDEAATNGQKVYGCVIPKSYRKITEKFTISSAALRTDHPYDKYVNSPKDNSFGMGYSGLDRSIFGHINLLEPSKLVVRGKNNKKTSIRGQAFGVGAFEREDEDIYKADDMTKYDFILDDQKAKRKQPRDTKAIEYKRSDAPETFIKAKAAFVFINNFPAPTIPKSFSGIHKLKKSRFEPIQQSQPPEPKHDKKIVHDASTRTEIIQEPEYKSSRAKNADTRKKNLDMLLNTDRFVSCTTSKKQAEENVRSDTVEKSFPESPFFSDRFVSATQTEDLLNPMVPVKKTENLHGTADMRRAAELKMFGPLTRVQSSWNPCAMLCKRFNVPPPMNDSLVTGGPRKRTKLLIFEYQKAQDRDTELKPGLTETKAPEVVEETVTPTIEEIAVEIVPAVDTTERSTSRVEEVIVKDDEKAAPVDEEINVERNMDLFKAVFLSSSEDEDDEREEKPDETHLEIITKEISQAALPTFKTKLGVLSDINFCWPPKPPDKSRLDAKSDRTDELKTSDLNVDDKRDEEPSYGPKLPNNPNAAKTSSITSHSNQLFVKVDEEDWIEKDEAESLRKSETHKHKKKKHKKDSDKKKHKVKRKKHKKDKRC